MSGRLTVIAWALVATSLSTSTCCGADALHLGFTPVVRSVEHREGDQRPVTGTLVRDLARQALLVAARDELGLRTLDAALREQAEDENAADALSLELTADARINKECTVRISQTVDGQSKEVYSHVFQFTPNSKETYLTLTPQFEEFSRSEFVEALKKLGVQPPSRPADVTEPEGDYAAELEAIDALLPNVDVISQFVAVRKAHAVVAERGESPEALVRLVRGYANLGLLTETTWSPASNTLKARSLVYAARLLAKYPDDPTALAARAYAHALAGIHFAALADLEKLHAAKGDGDQGEELPAWAGLIAPYCNYDLMGLREAAEDEQLAPWASYLALWAAYGAGEERIFVDEVRQSVQRCPEAVNICYLLAMGSPIGVMRMAESAAMSNLFVAMPARLQETSGIPEAVAKAAKALAAQAPDAARWRQVLDGLRTAGQRDELDWSALAALLEDAIVHIGALTLKVQRAAYQEHPVDEVVAMFLPLVEQHPAGAFFKTVLPLRQNDAAALREAVRGFQFENPNRWMYGIGLYPLWDVRNERNEAIGSNAYHACSRDFTSYSLMIENATVSTDEYYRKYRTMLMRELAQVSPASPLALVHEIRIDHEDPAVVTAKRLAEWERRAAEHAGPWRELGQLYRTRGDVEEAVRCYDKSFALVPEKDTIHALARLYEQEEMFDKVVPAYERYLEVEDLGLGHSQTHAAIAEFLIGRKEFEAARDHALSAAESYSASGLEIAARCLEFLGERDEADHWYAELSRAYPSSSGRQWWFYRARAGLPEVVEAKELAEKHLGDKQQRNLASSGWWPVAYLVLGENYPEALALAKLRAQQDSDLYSESHLLTLALETGDDKVHRASRARLMRLSDAEVKKTNSWPARYARAIDAVLQAESEEALPVDEIDELVKDDDATIGWCDACYFFGKLCLAKKFDGAARRYLQQCADFRDAARITWHLGSAELARLGDENVAGGDPGEEAEAEEAVESP